MASISFMSFFTNLSIEILMHKEGFPRKLFNQH